MTPILYAPHETNFTHNGLGKLSECLTCTVTEERNGLFEASFQYPVTGMLYSYISEGCFIKTRSNETSQPQIFRIYKSSKPINGIVNFNCEHISYELNAIPIESVEFTAQNGAGALKAIVNSTATPCKYEVWSDIETLNGTRLDFVSVRTALGGIEGSILDVFGGEYEFDNRTIKLHSYRGRDAGVKISYGKNLTDITAETDITGVYNALFPYAKYTVQGEDSGENEEITVTLKEKILYSPNKTEEASPAVQIRDFSQDFSEVEEITEDALRNKATQYINNSGFDALNNNITVSFINLWGSPEYAEIAPLERVSLCDTVTVLHKQLGVIIKTKVIRTVYDCLNEQYVSIELGAARANFADTVKNIGKEIKREVTKQNSLIMVKIAEAVSKATALITGQNGGYVVLNPSQNPQEILILDKPDINKSVNVWRFNSAGLGFSSTGYNGTYNLAITMDGKIVADFITAGILKGNLLEAGSVLSSAISQEFKNSITNEISGATDTITQNFQAADGELISQIYESYVHKNDLKNVIEWQESEINQVSDLIEFRFTQGREYTQTVEDAVILNQERLEEYIRFKGALIELGGVGNDFTAQLSNTELAFLQNNVKIAYVSNNKMYITDSEVLNRFKIGSYAFIPRSNGSLDFKFIGNLVI